VFWSADHDNHPEFLPLVILLICSALRLLLIARMSGLLDSIASKIDQARGTDLEKKVKAATSPENWHASSTVKNEIASATYDYASYREVMPIIWKRLNESTKNWAIVNKTVALLEHLVRCGSERVVDECRERLYQIQTLENFHCVDEQGRDRGAAVRDSAKQLRELLNDRDKLKEARAAAAKNKDKYVGVSSSGEISGRSYAGFSNNSYDADDRYRSPYEREDTTSSKPKPQDDATSDSKKRPAKKKPIKPAKEEDEEEEAEESEEEDKPKKSKGTGKTAKSKPTKIEMKIGAASTKSAPQKLAPIEVGVGQSSVPQSQPPSKFDVFDPFPGSTPGNTATTSGFDDFNPRASKPNSSKDDDWAPFSSTSAPSSTPIVPVTGNNNSALSMWPQTTAPVAQSAPAPTFDIFASAPKQPAVDLVSALADTRISDKGKDDFTDFVSAESKDKRGGVPDGKTTVTPSPSKKPLDPAWDTGLVNLSNFGGTQKKQQQPVASGPGTSMAELQGNSLSGLGLPPSSLGMGSPAKPSIGLPQPMLPMPSYPQQPLYPGYGAQYPAATMYPASQGYPPTGMYPQQPYGFPPSQPTSAAPNNMNNLNVFFR